jgi:hypothetical protein
MSDIIYTPPASGGGGGQNPTANFLPLNNGTSSFVDSNIYNDLGNEIYTNNFGWYISFGIKKFVFVGDYQEFYSGTFLIVDDFSSLIHTRCGGNNIGINLDFAANVYFLGDFNGVSGTNSSFAIDNNNGVIYTQGYTQQNGILLDFGTNQYFLGDYNGTGNTSYISIKDSSKAITLSTNGGTIVNICDSLVFSGSLTTGSASGNSGQHLQVTINGTPYVIQLLNP